MKKILCIALTAILTMGAIPAAANVMGPTYSIDKDVPRVVYENITYAIIDGEATAYVEMTDRDKLTGTVKIREEVDGYRVTSICIGIFINCTNIEEIILPEGIEEIPWHMAKNCKSLKRITIPEGVKVISPYAFEYCESLEEVNLPDSLETISMWAFKDCSSLKKISLPKGLKEIVLGAFAYTSIEELNLPASVESLSRNSFYGMENSIKKVTLDENNEYFTTDGTAIYTKDMTRLVWDFAYCDEPIYVVPESVNYIEGLENDNVEEILLHEGLNNYNWIIDCKNLKRIIFPNDTMFGDNHVEVCNSENLQEVIIGGGCNYIGEDAFIGCDIGLLVIKSADAKIRRESEKYGTSSAFDRTTIKTIFAPAGSDAETYAREKNINFVAIDAENITVFAHGDKVEFTDAKPIIRNERTLVPMRAIFEAMGATVTWDDDEKCAIGEKDGVTVKIKIGEAAIYKNREKAELDCAAEIVDDRTMVPVRAIAEAFGAHVDWDNETRCVIITE